MTPAHAPAAALFAHAPAATMAAPALPERRQPGTAVPSVPVDGMELCREELATALFEGEADLCGVPGVTTDALYDLARAKVRELGPAGLVKLLDDFSGLDAVEFPEVGDCRWYAWRLTVSFTYRSARARPMTAGEATAALYHSPWRRTATAGRPGPRQVAAWVRHGAHSLPVTALTRLGRAVAADLAHAPGRAPADWLHDRLMPDRSRAAACFRLIRATPHVPLPVIVRTDAGALMVGQAPPAGPGNRWPRPLGVTW